MENTTGKAVKRRAFKAAVTVSTMIFAVFLSACSKTMETPDAAKTLPAETPAAAATDSTIRSALPDSMENGEIVLGGAADGRAHFEGSVPEEKISVEPGMAAWLLIPGTGVETQVQATKADHAVYLDPSNSTEFNDPNTVLHGEADTEDAALHGLLAYGDSSFFGKHPYLYLYLPDKTILEYKVFAAYTQPSEDILEQHDCYDFSTFRSYMQGILSQRSMSSVTDAGMQDQILQTWCVLTIQASMTDGSDYLVQATLTGAGSKQ